MERDAGEGVVADGDSDQGGLDDSVPFAVVSEQTSADVPEAIDIRNTARSESSRLWRTPAGLDDALITPSGRLVWLSSTHSLSWEDLNAEDIEAFLSAADELTE